MMKLWCSVVIAGVFMVGLVGCATSDESMGMESGLETLDAKALAKVFSKGSQLCKWSMGDTKGEDFYYTTGSSMSGDADRNEGAKSTQGTWMVKGDQLCLDYGTEQCYRVHKAGKKSYKAVGTDGKVALAMSC
ncbi:MAG: hypothetical protein ACI8PT_002022 [Gammaproteobacteria bacterium]|jgi:hypothetical protein